MVHGLLSIPTAAAVAVAVHHHWQLAILGLGIQWQVVAAHQLEALLVGLWSQANTRVPYVNNDNIPGLQPQLKAAASTASSYPLAIGNPIANKQAGKLAGRLFPV